MVNFPFKKTDGFEVPFPSQGRVGRERRNRDGRLTVSTSVSGGAEMDAGTRAFLPHLSRDVNNNCQQSSGSLIASSVKTASIELDYDDLDAIESSEQSIAAAAIKARTPYVASQQITLLTRILYVMVTAIILGALAALVVFIIIPKGWRSSSTSPSSSPYTPPKPASEINLWCDFALLNTSKGYKTCNDACIEGMCCFGDEFESFPSMQGEQAHQSCFSQPNGEVCSLYKPCENLITARDHFFFFGNYSAVPLPPDDLDYICSQETTQASMDNQFQCEDLCGKAKCCYPQHPSSCSITNAVDCSPYSICWGLSFVLDVVEAIDDFVLDVVEAIDEQHRSDTNKTTNTTKT